MTGKHCDMTEVLDRLVKDKRRVVPFPISEYWLDIGCVKDYQQAQKDIGTISLREQICRS
jgi:NDP-sugar pyrophosphorylase family protein